MGRSVRSRKAAGPYHEPVPRTVSIVLCSGSGALLGMLPSFDVPTPWWPDVEPVEEAVAREHALDITVLRLLVAEASSDAMGGAVTYLAEVAAGTPDGGRLGPVASALAALARQEDPHRAPWASPGGVERTLAWADATLAAAGTPRTGDAVHVKSWNLSSLLRVPTATGDVWCKSVPPFLGHEGAVIEAVGGDDPGLVPDLLGTDPGRTVLLRDVPGADQWEAPEADLIRMVRRWVGVQARWAERVDELLGRGLPDWRGPALAARLTNLVQRPDVRAQLTPSERTAVDAVLAELPARLDAIARCGLPETLVHGDLHPGNWRSDGSSLVLLDWGDSGIGHPMLDTSAFLPRVGDAVRPRVGAAWAHAWRAHRPGSDPERAAELIGPVAALRQALVYQTFLDGIEVTERRYHEDDVARWLRRATA